MTEWDHEVRRADVVILTAIRLEFDAVLKVDAGAVPESVWEEVLGPSGLPVAFRSFVVAKGRPLRVAVAVSPDMGATAAVNTLLPLVEKLKPRCIAMCGVCAGRCGKTQLGDVVAAERLFYHDTGKQLPKEIQQDLTTYKLRDDWKAALEGMDVAAHFRDAAWFKARPLTTEWRERRALVALQKKVAEPWKKVDRTLDERAWKKILASLRRRKLLAKSGQALSARGRQDVKRFLFENKGRLPNLSPTGKSHRFGLHVASMGSGTRVIEDEKIWIFISQAMRKTLGLEMEAAALGELAHRQRQHQLDAVVMKGVMDFANHGRDDHFKEFAARASAECLLWFLREHVPPELMAGFDDLLTPGTLPTTAAGARSPSFLLNAQHQAVPWHDAGRSEILADLDTWADHASLEVAVRLLHAEGGVGKTRLAIEWVRRRREQYDVAGFLVPNPDDRWLERLCGLGPPVLVVIDYAERRADLVTLLERVAAFAAGLGPRRRVRMLLLARGDGDWWAALPRRSVAIGALLGNCAAIKLPPLATTTAEREAVFVEAARWLAELQHRPLVLRPPSALDDDRFARVLYLHMAALAAVEGIPFDAGSLMDVILDHEQRFWSSEGVARHEGAVDVALARQLVVAATLRGGLKTEHEAREMFERLTKRGRTREDDVLIKLLHDVYERTDAVSYLPGLEPDLLGEGMVLRVAVPPKGAGWRVGDTWIERVFATENDVLALTTAFAVLGHASATNPAAVGPWIANLLRGELPSRAVLALRAAKAVGRRTASSILGDLLAEALEQGGSPSIAAELTREEIPYPTVSLRRVAEWQSRVRLEHAPEGDDTHILVTRAELLLQQGIRLSDLGQPKPALAATREAVSLSRTLVARNPGMFQARLAGSLNNLGNKLGELGQREGALEATREAVELYRTLASCQPNAFQPYLATSLNNLGTCLSALGQRGLALAAAREAIELYRTLASHNPDVFQSHLAGSLRNLGAWLSEMGQRESALESTREAVDLYRTLVIRNPDAFQPGFAMSLNDLGIRLSDLGQRDLALIAIREAVSLHRILANRNPDAFQPDLATSLNNLGNQLSDLGQRESALAAAKEAVDLDRTLVSLNREQFQPALARSLDNLGNRLSDLDQRQPALEATREAVELFRTLASRNSDAFGPSLAMSLNNLGSRLTGLGQCEPALTVIREAVDLYRMLTSHNSDAFQPGLAMSLDNLGTSLSALSQCQLALEVTHEAVDLYRALSTRNPDAFHSDLARSLNNLGIRLGELGQHEPALAATREAVDLYRALSTRHPDAFQPELARSLNNLGIRLGHLGQHESALAATHEMLILYRELTSRNPDTFLPDLARGLNNLGTRLSEVGERETALAHTRQAVDLYRMLTKQHPDTFKLDLAMSLNNLGNRLGEIDQRQPALAATREAVELYRTLATRHPAAFQSYLAGGLNNLGLRLSALGQRQLALEATHEAVELYRTLTACNPDVFQTYLATSLSNLGNRLSELGRRKSALAAFKEAADLRSFASQPETQGRT